MSCPSTSLIVDFPSQHEFRQHKSTKACRQRSVQFSTMSQMHITEPIDRPWYTHQDEQQFRVNSRNEMLSYLRTKLTAQDAGVPLIVSCPFGLEKQLVSKDFSKKRALSRRLVMAAVHMEQQAQYSHEHEYDRQERIAAASIQHSEWSKAQALTIGNFQSTTCLQD